MDVSRAANGHIAHMVGAITLFGTPTPATYERLAWYTGSYFPNDLLSYVVAIPMLALVCWPVVAALVWLVRRRTRLVTQLRPGPARGWRATAVAIAIASAALAAWFGFGVLAATDRAAEREGGEIVSGLRTPMHSLPWAPAALAALAALLLVATVMGWRRRWWSIPGLLLFTTITANALLFVALLVRRGDFPVATG